MKLIPVGQNILVEPLKKEETTKSGLIIESKGESRPEQGTVIRLGEEYKGLLKVGEQVLFKKYAPDEVDLDGTKLLIMKEEDILAVVTNETKK